MKKKIVVSHKPLYMLYSATRPAYFDFLSIPTSPIWLAFSINASQILINHQKSIDGGAVLQFQPVLLHTV